MVKYVFVTGGVVSGIGKGIAASSIALLLKSRGYKVFMQKYDPYINVDPGLMSPLQHGEVFVTADGSETDLDLGHYERFIDEELNYSSSISTGKIFSSVIEKERLGKYKGGTVQIVPHITEEIKKRIYEAVASSKADIIITEIGGTVGDIESQAVLEALRQIRYELGKEATLFVHMTLIPYMFGSGELKTKPTQHSVIDLRRLGIQPDIILCRAPSLLSDEIKQKISLFCSLPPSHVLDAIDAKTVYKIPINFHNQKLDEIILDHFNLPLKKVDLTTWNNLIDKVQNLNQEITVALIGSYIKLNDAYLSVKEALNHAGYHLETKIKITWINPKDLKEKEKRKEIINKVQGIVIPYGPFKKELIEVINYARLNKIPFLGIELGFYMALIEYGENVCHLKEATTSEVNKTIKEPLIKERDNNNNNVRLGNYKCLIKNKTKTKGLYNFNHSQERHRNKYEVNLKYEKILKEKGLIISGYDEKNNYIEIIELPDHPFFIATLFRPEFKSRPIKCHPLFLGFINSCLQQKKEN